MNIKAIKNIKDFKTLAHFLAEELNWPIDPENTNVEDITFDYEPDEIGLSDEYAAKVKTIKQLQPLNSNQPWSVFWIDFESKKLPLTVLRRILSAFVQKKRGNNRNFATKDLEDLLFVSGHGEDTNRAITFAHFKRLDDVETIREFYWDGHETKFDHLSNYLENLAWPTNTTDVEAWRAKWKGAFTGSTREAISTSDQLAKAMASIARKSRVRVLEVLSVERKNGPIHKLYDTFREGLVHDMTEKGFADMYAQTITYGLFSARTMDTDGHFELHEVIDLIPQTNPFLKNLFKECLKAGDKKHKIDLDELGVGSLVDLFDNLNRSDGTDAMQRILSEFGRQTLSGQEDPVIHFYEGFLGEYDKTQKIEKGVFYTPDPIVSFIVRSVNEQLKSEFGLEMGLADTTTWSQMVASGRAAFPVDPKTGKLNNEWKEKIKERAFVQILDPATGTGTFLKHVIEIIHEEVKAKHKRDRIQTEWVEYWNDYVYKDLLPRIYGFELMMASYSVAHMKIGMYLKSLGYKFEKEQRLNIYLTNSLEPHTANSQSNFFFSSVGAEAIGANNVKEHRYFSVVIGNPPYSGISKNNDPWISNLIEDYKYIDGEHFKERKHWLNADEIKFIRLGEFLVDKNGIGILAYINPHSFLDNPTFRGMRWNLLEKFNDMYILDLHGNSRNTNSNDGSGLINVFDIIQGVSINLFIKSNKMKTTKLGNIFHFDLFGKREYKYNYLGNASLKTIDFNQLTPEKPLLLFVPRNNNNSDVFKEGFQVEKLFLENTSGIQTSRDFLVIDSDLNQLKERLERFIDVNKTTEEIRQEFFSKAKVTKYLRGDTRGWRIAEIRPQLQKKGIENFITQISYRPFDKQFICYTKLLVDWTREKTQKQLLKSNLSITIGRQGQATGDNLWDLVFIQNSISDLNLFYRGGGIVCPLYLYSDTESQQNLHKQEVRIPNLSLEIVKRIEKSINSKFTKEKENKQGTFAPVDILDYIYSILHSPMYREKYKEFLKSDFPIIPYPKDTDMFCQLVKLGSELRQVHLLESTSVNKFITKYPIKGDDIISKISYLNKKVYINKTQYFENVPQVAWEFFIGGYQPAQKWLKDRKDRELSEEDINHYQRIIVALTETDRLMKEIDKIEIEEISTTKIVKMYPINDEDSSLRTNVAAETEKE